MFILNIYLYCKHNKVESEVTNIINHLIVSCVKAVTVSEVQLGFTVRRNKVELLKMMQKEVTVSDSTILKGTESRLRVSQGGGGGCVFPCSLEENSVSPLFPKK